MIKIEENAIVVIQSRTFREALKKSAEVSLQQGGSIIQIGSGAVVIEYPWQRITVDEFINFITETIEGLTKGRTQHETK